MTQSNKPEFEGAQAALSRALESLQRRIENVDHEMVDMKQRRKRYLDDLVETLLPDISGKTLRSLRDVIPAFLTREVLAAFQDSGKVLGLFRGEQYQNKLSMLQTRLASFLDQKQFGKLKQMDEENAPRLAALIADKGALNDQAQKAMELIDLMQKAKKANIALPAEAKAQIRQFASVGRSGSSPTGGTPRTGAPVGAPVTTSASLVSSSSSSNDDSDLWFYFMTDIPTSFRTLMIESITEDRAEARAEQAAQNASVDTGGGPTWDSTGDVCAPSDSSSQQDQNAAAFAAAECAVISTDDSLGRFS